MPASRQLVVDGDVNGGISVTGEDRRDVQVRAVVHAWAASEAEAQRIADEVVVRTDGTLRAEGPDQTGRVREQYATDQPEGEPVAGDPPPGDEARPDQGGFLEKLGRKVLE